MQVTCFGSGSNGNSLLVQSETTSVLIDAGVPVRLIRGGLRQAGVPDALLAAVLISHEHHDHIRSATQLARHQPVPFFGTRGTIRALGGGLAVDWHPMSDGLEFSVGDLRITPLTVSHDAEEPVGFVISDGMIRVSIFTDLGEPSTDVSNAIHGASLVVLESNYDEEMLRVGPYPAHLKRRIRGPLGHLSNAVCADVVAGSIDGRTTEVWLAHISEKNNRPHIAKAATQATVGAGSDAPRVTALPHFGSSIFWDSTTAADRPRQTSLF